MTEKLTQEVADTVVTEEEFIAELDRRAAELKSDPSLAVSWEIVRNMR
jgi:putative addiction module component (TIGR02574 family)